jgi:peptidoglycan DL-endopeptidase RipA
VSPSRRPEAPAQPPRVAVAIFVIVVGVVIVAAIATVARAAAYRPAAGGQIVFTVTAPYHPGAAPAANIAQAAGVPPPQGNWTAARGDLIAKRALAWVGWPYSFGGGNASGPTYGFAVDKDSRNDATVRGFDCSGLVINALAPWMALDHDAAAQYSEAGSAHPALDALQPGDLVFWSRDGTVDGVGHVAIYIGNGNVVQAPRSGAYVTVTRIDQVEPGRIGTTRPLT